MLNTNGYTVAKVKTFRGMEGEGFNADLLKDGKKVAFVYDDAHGGEFRFEWVDHKAPRIEFEVKGYDDVMRKTVGTELEKTFRAFIDALPPHEFQGEMLSTSPDIFVDDLVQDFLARKKFKALIKKSVIFITDKGELRNTKGTVDPLVAVQAIAKSYPTATILNGHPNGEQLFVDVMMK